MDLNFLTTLPHFSGLLYAALFVGMFVEANLTIVACAFLILRHLINPFFGIPLVIAGGFFEQYALYFLGLHLGQKEKLAHYVNKVIGRYDSHFIHNTFRSLLVSKFIYGLHRLVLIRTGMLKISLEHFTKSTIKSTGLWLLSFFILGFVFSASYAFIKHYFKYGEVALLIVFAVFFTVEYLLSKNLRKDL